MTETLRSLATTHFTMLIFEFADPEGLNKAKLEEQMRCPLLELFDRQKNADKAKRLLKDDFNKALALYFNTYQTSQGFAFERLEKKLDECAKVFARHLGKDKVQYLRLLISVAKCIPTEKRKGLLDVA